MNTEIFFPLVFEIFKKTSHHWKMKIFNDISEVNVILKSSSFWDKYND